MALLLAGCSDVFGPSLREELKQEYDAVVEMNDDNEFVPETVTISVGESVVWFNNGRYDHTVTAYEDEIPERAEYFASGGYDSEQDARENSGRGRLGAEETYDWTFQVPGEYEYFCLPHEVNGMIGTVIVEE